MQLEGKKYLYDIQQACERLKRYTADKTLQDYESDDLLRSGVERQFEIMGEALHGLSRIEPDTADSIPEYRRYIGFRNRLIHGYSMIDDRIVWDILTIDLPRLSQAVNRLSETNT